MHETKPSHIQHEHSDIHQVHITEDKSHILPEYPLTVKGIKIDPVIFTQGFVERCDIGICSAECCWYGVYADVKERDLILSMKEEIGQLMDETQTKDWNVWFEPPQADTDFPSGECAGTEVFNDKCVFLNKKGFCSLQELAVNHGKDKWAYKPFYCVLFPVVVVDGVLTFDDHHSGRMHHCGVKENFTHTLFESCTEELIYTLGEDGYQELAAHYEQNKEKYLSQISFR